MRLRYLIPRLPLDVFLFAYNALTSTEAAVSDFKWDSKDNATLERIVNKLSNINDLERVLIRRIIREKNIASILDCACGPGTELKGYTANGLAIAYTGLDQSEDMLAIARRRNNAGDFRKGNVENLPFNDNSYEAVLLKHVLEHLSDYRTVVSEAVRVSSRYVILNFFHRLLPCETEFFFRHRKGCWENWYSRSGFEAFLSTLPIKRYDKTITRSIDGNTAEIYVIEKA